MLFEETPVSGVMLLQPNVFGDERGFFLESWNQQSFAQAGFDWQFVQDNQSRSSRGVLRGLHYQIGTHAQAKLVRVVSGEIFDVAVDLRASSAQFGQWAGVTLNAIDHSQLWIPEGFAHGFLVLSESAEVFYKTTAYYSPGDERSVYFNDPDIGVQWPAVDDPVLSERDAVAGSLADAQTFR